MSTAGANCSTILLLSDVAGMIAAMDFLIRTAGDPWRAPTGQGYTNEAALQQQLAEHPELIPGVAPGAQVCRELHSSAGYADVVVLGDNGELTLVECKLAANPQVRREVVAQALDYASRLWRMSIEEFEQAWTLAAGHEPFADAPELRPVVAENLRAARLTLVLAVDAINDELRRIVEFLNSITVTDTAVIAVEYVRYYEGELEILRPRTFGTELVQARQTPPSSDYYRRTRWQTEDVLTWAKEHDSQALPALQALIDGWEAAGWTIAGGKALDPSLNIATTVRQAGSRWPFVIYTGARGVQLEIRYGDLKQFPDVAHCFARAVAEHLDVGLSLEDIMAADFGKRPRIPLKGVPAGTVHQLVAAVSCAVSPQAWALDERALDLIGESPAWRDASTHLHAAGVGETPRDVFDARLGLLGRTWPDEASCRQELFANHAGGLPVELAEQAVRSCSPSAN